MSTDLDASSDASDPAATPEHAAIPRLAPPPRQAPPRPAPPATRSAALGAVATWITAAFFGVLGLAAIAVFVVLPDWVRARQQPPAELVARPQAPQPMDLETMGRETMDRETMDREIATGERAGEDQAEAPQSSEAPQLAEAPPRQAPPRQAPPRQAPSRQAPQLAEAPIEKTAEAWATPPPTLRTAASTPPAPGGAGFERAMTDGLAALDREDYAAAREAFARAATLRPGSPQSADGLARTEVGARLAGVSALREQALTSEAQEDWHNAQQQYGAVLELDPLVGFALDGLARSRRRAELSDDIDFHLAKQERLTSDEVLQETSAILEQALEIEPAGPKLRRQREQLAQAVEAFSTAVTATLESDELTEIVVYRVGRLGTFSRRALDLRPGTYTVVGSRRGFRDVRRQLVIEPGVEPRPLAIRCEEKI